jgi:hypothetical protein
MLQHLDRYLRTGTTPAGIGGVGLVLALLAGACGHGHHDVTLPTSSGNTAPNASPSPTTAEDAIRQSYTQYWVVLPKAEHTDSESQRRRLLADYAVDPQLSTALRGIDDLHGRDLTSSGYVIVRIKKVQLVAGTATVWDCQDATHALIQKRSTGKAVSRGVSHDYLRATLLRGSDGRWRISKFAPLAHC